MGSRFSRRSLLRAGAALTAAGVGLDAFAVEPRWLSVSRWDVQVPGLPQQLEGFTVAQVTDVHLPGSQWLHQALGEALRAEPVDLLAITGDVVESEQGLAGLPGFLEHLRGGGATVLATLGNWEHWGSVPTQALAVGYGKAGIRLLVNEHLVLPDGPVVVGTDDSCSGNADLPRAFRDAPADRPRILLTHAPGAFEAAPPASARAALSLSGHTHGGQVTAFGAPLVLPPGSGRFSAGAYSTPVGPLYVCRGLGVSVVPARFCCRPELARFRLLRGEPAGLSPRHGSPGG